MNKNAIKKYAIWARRELIDRVSKKAMRYGISPDSAADPDAFSVDGRLLSDTEQRQRRALIARVAAHGYAQTMEEAAYTWFNRLTALRFMEVNGYLPSHVRVFTDDAGAFRPQILTEAIHLELPGLDMEQVYALKEANDEEALYRCLLIVQCNALNDILPGMFQRLGDVTELLLPDNLLREGSVIERLISEIPEEDFNDINPADGKDGSRIEIIGWLYQYYITEKHEEVVDPLHGKVVKKDEVPAATQLFTTDWVVRYLIDNSVGRYWIERNPNSALVNELTYFVKPKDGVIKTIDEKITPQELSVFDPCVGSGHFLVYAFDILMKIYVEYGYTEREAATEIVKNNLYGLDIDGRAAQLAYFALMMKARRYDRRFFSRKIQPHVYEILESNDVDEISAEHFCNGDSAVENDVKAILETFRDAKEYGSILQMPMIDFGKINERFVQLADEVSLYNTYLLDDFQKLVRVAEVMSGKYAVVATNPPYLNKFDAKLKAFIADNYNDYKGDLFSVFMYRNFDFCIANGYLSFMTPNVWMFIKTYEKLRSFISNEKNITSLIQMAKGAFFKEATVDICAFTCVNGMDDSSGIYIRLENFKGDMEVQRIKTLEAIETQNESMYFEANAHDFKKIPGSPIAYWASKNMVSAFSYRKFSEVSISNGQNITGNNNRFLRLFWEVDDTHISEDYWVKCARGGGYRRYHGNDDNVILWTDAAREHYHKDNIARIIPKELRFREGITWSYITSGKPSFRKLWSYQLFEKAGSSIFIKNTAYLNSLLGLLNSVVATKLLEFINPTINYQVRDILFFPIAPNVLENNAITSLVEQNISISRTDWDSFETSWDFGRHPLLAHPAPTLAAAYEQYRAEANARFDQLKANEEELNRIFIDIYGLADELTPAVEERDVTVRRIFDTKEDIPASMRGSNYAITRADVVRSLISYAVGCMFGRYSLDTPGLAYAGGDWDGGRYTTFLPDEDGIIPICDNEYFDDDIVERFAAFLTAALGAETLEENLQFVADALGTGGSPREVIRSYFLTTFYADHVKTYQKRPIYWLFDSGKKNGFKCLVYMHRYDPNTLARIRTDYVHEQQSRYRTAISNLEDARDHAATAADRVSAGKKLASVIDREKELLAYEEKIHHLADQRLTIDLDDGVKHNYAIFQDVLAKIK